MLCFKKVITVFRLSLYYSLDINESQIDVSDNLRKVGRVATARNERFLHDDISVL